MKGRKLEKIFNIIELSLPYLLWLILIAGLTSLPYSLYYYGAGDYRRAYSNFSHNVVTWSIYFIIFGTPVVILARRIHGKKYADDFDVKITLLTMIMYLSIGLVWFLKIYSDLNLLPLFFRS